jgi:5-methylcytosine-specific restriction endonuclease McrA
MGLPRKWDPMLPSKPEPKGKGRGAKWHRFKEQLRHARGIYACEQCKAVCDYLEAHHVVRVHDDPSREFDARNVRFLCKDCHTTAHNGSKTGVVSPK